MSQVANGPSPPAGGGGIRIDLTLPVKKEGDAPDAGLRSLDHYKRALPRWRYSIRQKMIPLIRWETPYLAALQSTLRRPALDSYFAISANLGTHTFYMIGLPILFWCGLAAYGKGLVHILAGGVFFTGFIKDFFSLPRPLSPPLHRITMTGYAALEYGFPSTHSANAVSVALYALLLLRRPENTLSESTKFGLELASYFYAISIVFGRLYCGMHGFVDVIFGSILGIAIGWLEFTYGPPLDFVMHTSSWVAPFLLALIVIVLVRIHPEPADDCPCFDDSVAFAGVVIGVEAGTWMYGKTPWDPWDGPAHGPHSINIRDLGPVKLVCRIILGVFAIFAWREIMKPALLKGLPHLFRIIERPGLIAPRRFFKSASEYKSVTPGIRIDTLFPAVSDIPRVVESIGNPKTRGRSVSIGPQSAADAYETLAYRERRRRESIGSNGSLRSTSSLMDLREGKGDGMSTRAAVSGSDQPAMNGQAVGASGQRLGDDLSNDGGTAANALEEKEVFSHVIKSRVRYDVEVVTKLVIYTGVGWLSVAIVPIMFEFVGLGASHLRTS